MKVIILPNAASVYTLSANIMAHTIRQDPYSVLGFATGRTMEALYENLVSQHQNGRVDCSHITGFNLDEYVGLSHAHPQSYFYYMRKHLFDALHVPIERTYIPSTSAPDPEKEARAYDALIHEKGGISLQLLGIGENGHIGFNEPLSGLTSRTRPVTLTKATLEQNASLFNNNPHEVPKKAITMGIGTILEARSLLLVATGRSKAQAIARMIEGPLQAMVPASALQMHPHCLVVIDEDAASYLSCREALEWQLYHDEELSKMMECYTI